MTITRSAQGRYSVRFAGLGGNGTAGGNVQVTAYGSGSESCKVVGWASSSPDFTTLVLQRQFIWQGGFRDQFEPDNVLP